MRYYKLTDQKLQARHGFQWEIGKWQSAKGDINQPLCSSGWLHGYDSPLIAILHNPIHGNVKNPRLFEVETSGEALDENGTKCGFRRMRLVRELPIPQITNEQALKYALLCLKCVYSILEFAAWAEGWLSGKDRTQDAARIARSAIARALDESDVRVAMMRVTAAAVKTATKPTALATKRTLQAAATAAAAAAEPSPRINFAQLAEDVMR